MSSSRAGLTIQFTTSYGVGECSGRAFEVDPESGVVPGTRVKFKVYGSKPGMVSNLSLAAGTRPLTGTYFLRVYEQNYTENLSFNGSDKVQLKYPVAGSLTVIAQTDIMRVHKETSALSLFKPGGSIISSSMQKVGFSCCGPIDKTYNLYGTIKVKYNIAYHIKTWNWTAPNRAGDYYFYLTEDSNLLYSHKITIEEDAETLSPVSVAVVVKEYSSENFIEGATVQIDGETLSGTTDENGTIMAGALASGRHTIKITKTGYVDSDEDDLENDSFIIS